MSRCANHGQPPPKLPAYHSPRSHITLTKLSKNIIPYDALAGPRRSHQHIGGVFIIYVHTLLLSITSTCRICIYTHTHTYIFDHIHMWDILIYVYILHVDVIVKASTRASRPWCYPGAVSSWRRVLLSAATMARQNMSKGRLQKTVFRHTGTPQRISMACVWWYLRV